MKSLTQDDAYTIAHKLGATIEKRRRHDWAIVEYMGRVVAQYGIRRASREKNHDHIPEQLKISRSEARGLADCPFSKDDYFTSLCSRGKIPMEGENGTNKES